jgi:hypothetical protein
VDNEEIPYTLGDKFKEEQGRLRNKLLRFRLDNYFKVSAKNIEDVRLPNIEPRLKQAFSPFIILLQDELEALAGLEQFLQTYNQRLVKERADSLEGRIIEKVFGLAEKNRKDYISASDILKELGDEAETLSVQKVGRRLSALGIETGEPKLKPGADKKRRHIIWDDKLMRRLKAKYIPGE